MQLELAQKIVQICEDIGYCEENEMPAVREDYGYGCGHKTTAITDLSLSKLIGIILENADRFVDEDGYPLFQSVPNFSQNNLGLGTIIY
jgi:hypothetical protein